MSQFDGSITVREGTLHFSSSIDVNNLTLVAGSTLQVDGGISVSGDVRVEATSIAALRTVASVSAEEVSSFDGTAVVNGNLDLTNATSLTMAAAIDMGGNTLTLNDEAITLSLDIDGIGENVRDLTLMTQVGNITNIVEDPAWQTQANAFFTADYITEDTMLVYDGSTLMLKGLHTIPEPTTATLSLLALAALAARRRR
ncbi:MAG: hypothetical protein Q4C03_08070 [bacterium]|nr:hypothetical protein [bacterium]